MAATDDLSSQRFFHGTKVDLEPGDLIEPGDRSDPGEPDRTMTFVYLTDSVDAAAWQSELAPGEGPGRIYTVVPTGPVTVDADEANGYPVDGAQRYHSREPLRVTGEVTDRQGHPRQLYHGTKADLRVGDLIKPGHPPNFGELGRTTTYVYLTGTLDAAAWGAELAFGEGSGRIYTVEPTGPIMDDPNLTDKRYPGNPTKSYRSREPLRVTGEVADWRGHSPEALKAMKDGLERLRQQGVQPLDD